MKAYVWSSSIAPSSPRLGTIWMSVDCVTLRSLYSKETLPWAHWTVISVVPHVALKVHESKPLILLGLETQIFQLVTPSLSGLLCHKCKWQLLSHCPPAELRIADIYFFQVCKTVQFAIRRNLLHPFSTGNFEAGGSSDTASHVTSRTAILSLNSVRLP